MVSGEGHNWGEQRMLWGHRKGMLPEDIRLQVKEVRLQLCLEGGPLLAGGRACAKNTQWILHTCVGNYHCSNKDARQKVL